MQKYMIFIGIYLGIVSLISIIMTVYDKHAARKRLRRVKESTLILVSLLGGSVAMLVVMRGIRHKTKHAKFMVGIPVIIILQLAAIFLVWYFKESLLDLVNL